MATLTAQKVKLYRETLTFLENYNNPNSPIKTSLLNAIKNTGKKDYMGVPLIGYAWIIFKNSPHFASSHGFNLLQALRNQDFEKFADIFDDLVTSFWESKNDWNSFEQEINRADAGEIEHPQFVLDEEHQELSRMESLPEGPVQQQAFDNFVQPRIAQFHTPQPPATESEHLRGEKIGLPSAGHLRGGEKTEVPAAFKEWKDIQQPFIPESHEEFIPPPVPSIPPIPSVPTVNLPAAEPKLPSVGRRFSFPSFRPRIPVSAERFIKRVTAPRNIATVFTGGLGSIVGFGITKTPLGAILGGAFGVGLKTAVEQKGAGQAFLGVAGRGGNAGASFISGLSPGGGGGRGFGLPRFGGGAGGGLRGRIGGGKVTTAFVLVFFGVALIMLLTAAAPPPTPGTTGTPGGQPIVTTNPTLTGGGEISSCQFTRSGSSKPVKSARLISIFQEVAAKSGVPVAALASLAMHESENFTSTALDNHDAFGSDITIGSGCKYFGLPSFGLGSSPTGALGIMQVQPTKKVHDQIWQIWETTRPPGSIYMKNFEEAGAHSVDGVRRGAELVGKTYDSLSLQDFCDIRTSVYLGAGVMISKNGDKPPTTSDDIKNAVCGYFGLCQYGPYNYGEEAKADFQNCQPITPSNLLASCPVSRGHISTGSYYSKIGTSQHCNAASGYSPACDPKSRRAKSIDVPTSSKVILPKIENKTLQWKFLQTYDDGYGALAHVFRSTDEKGINWDLQLLHLTPTSLILQSIYPSDTEVASPASGFDHVHITIGKNITNPTANCGSSASLTDLANFNKCNNNDPGWLNADTDAKMCM